LAAALLPSPASALIAGADDATDLCAAAADPCQVTQVVETVDGALLDFGTRTLEVLPGGRIDAGAGDLEVRCGRLRLATGTSIALNMKGEGPTGSSGGIVTIEVRRRCSGNSEVTCLSEIDCALADAGACTVGNGAAILAGRIFGSSEDPAFLTVLAAGSVEVAQQIIANGTAADADGGSVEIESGGTITVQAKIQVTSGADGTGGDISLIARNDVVGNEVLDATGGDFDGGFIEIDAGRDVLVTRDVTASANSGEGFGGEIAIDAVRDIRISGGTNTNRLTLQTDGHQSSELFGGDGGTQDYLAGRDVWFSKFVVARSSGAPPDGYGEEITLDAGRDLLLEGTIDVKSRGQFGVGGYFTAFAVRNATFTATSKIDMTAGDGGGEATLDSFGPLTFDGVIDATTAPVSFPGRADFTSAAGDLIVSGEVRVNGAEIAGISNLVTFDGCEVRFKPGAEIDNTADGAVTDVTARDRIVVESGATLRTPNGANSFTYRDAAQPPVVTGTVSPAPSNNLLPNLAPCPACGNSAVEFTETCDDGNLVAGDGCNAACQDEGCIAQTPGWPDVTLCDDGKRCTADSCDDAADACDHTVACSDGGICTADECGLEGDCLHLPDDALCDDGVSCTVDFCSFSGRCRATADNAACDDTIECTVDACDLRLDCRYTPIHVTCDDGNVCTTDQCVVGEGCTNPDNTISCDDGATCTTHDMCAGGQCVGVSACPEGQVCHPGLDMCGVNTTTTSSTVSTVTTLTTVTTTTEQPPTTTVPTTSTTLAEVACGNSQVEEGEDCDEGNPPWSPGIACRECLLLACGDADGSGTRSASDALFALRAAVRTVDCDCVCDIDGSSSITASDALGLLRSVVGLPVSLTCSCG
jgi:cysteine-rich repeat protein